MITIILVQPQMGENIGATARVMANCGLTKLRLVAPRDGWPNKKAENMASGALSHLEPIQVYDDFEQAIADMHFVLASSARPRQMVKPVYTPEQSMDSFFERCQKNETCALAFGAERTGMVNEDIAACQGIVNVPTNPDFSSLNLATSVSILSYEWRQKFLDKNGRPEFDTGSANKESPKAKQKDVGEFIARLEGELEEKHFFRSEGLTPQIKQNIKNIFTRMDMTEQELKTFHGIISALLGHKRPKD